MRSPHRNLQILLAALTVACLLTPAALAAGPDPSQVAALAIYSAKTGSDELPDSDVNYNVVDPFTISAILNGIEWNIPRVCTGLDADNNSYLYLQYMDGTRKVYHIFVHDSHIALKDQRGTCFYISPSAQTLILDNQQL